MLDQEPKYTRRQFIKGAALAGAAAVLTACGLKTPTPTPEASTEAPTDTPNPTVEPSPTRKATPEATATEKINQYPKVTLSEEYLKKGFGAIGGQEISGPTPEPNNPYKFSNTDDLVKYASDVFDNSEITFQGIAKDPIEILDVVAAMSLGSNVNYGVVGLGDVKDQNDKYLFEGLKDWKVWTGLMGRILGESIYQLPAEQASPREFTVREGTKLSIIGKAGQDQALVLLSEYFDRSAETFTARKVPRGWYVILPETLPDDTEGLSLQRLLRGVGSDYDPKTSAVSFKEGNEKALWPLPEIDPALMEKISVKRVGAAWVDHALDGKFYANPLIYDLTSEQKQGTQALTLKKNGDGVWEYWGVKVPDRGSELLFKAVWNEEGKTWVWEAEKPPVVVETITGLIAKEVNGKITYFAEAGNPYGLEEGEDAGHIVEYEIGKETQLGVTGPVEFEKTQGIVLDQRVIYQMLLEANNPEAIANGEWKIPFNFNPTGNEIKLWLGRIKSNYFAISGISSNTSFFSPITESVLSKFHESEGGYIIGLYWPDNWLPKVYRGINYGIDICYKTGNTTVSKVGTNVEYGEVILESTGGKLPERYPVNSEIFMQIGSLEGSKNMDWDNILHVQGLVVFMR